MKNKEEEDAEWKKDDEKEEEIEGRKKDGRKVKLGSFFPPLKKCTIIYNHPITTLKHWDRKKYEIKRDIQ